MKGKSIERSRGKGQEGGKKGEVEGEEGRERVQIAEFKTNSVTTGKLSWRTE